MEFSQWEWITILNALNAIGFTPHSDAVALTILCQVNETEGLQIRKEGRWVLVKPLPNAFVVNIGDIMEVLVFYNLDIV